VTLIIFSNIFAVSPTGLNPTIWIHTIPFWCLQLGMVLLALANTLHGLWAVPGGTSYWASMGVPEWVHQLAWGYVSLFIVVVLFKIPASFNAMLGQPWWTQTPNFMVLAGIMDRLFLICSAVVPMVKAVLFKVYKEHDLAWVHIDVDAKKRYRTRPPKVGDETYISKEGKRVGRSVLAISSFTVTIERVRLLAYSGFWLIVLLGIAITEATKGWYPGGAPADLQDSLLTHVFGYNNICVYFDYEPANFILPAVWAFVLPGLLLYCGAEWAHAYGRWEDGNLTKGQYQMLRVSYILAGVTLIIFSNIFAVSPTGLNPTIWIHTIPFWCLQFGMVILALANVLHGTWAPSGRQSYWAEVGAPSWFATAAWVYVAVFLAIVLFKIPAAFNAMLGQPWWTQTPGFMTLAGVMDRGFLICAAVIPMGKAYYFLSALGDHIDVIAINTDVSTNEEEIREPGQA